MLETGAETIEVEVTAAAVRSVASSLRTLVRALDPEAVALPDAPGLWREFDQLARLAGGAALVVDASGGRVDGVVACRCSQCG